jgi:hypothetical protein
VGEEGVEVVRVIAFLQSAGMPFQVVWAKFGGAVEGTDLPIHQPIAVESLESMRKYRNGEGCIDLAGKLNKSSEEVLANALKADPDDYPNALQFIGKSLNDGN